jgi:hypothetical protein
MADVLSTIGVQDFMKMNLFTSVVKVVRENANNYPYITFITGDNVAENIYFSKNASTLVGAGETIARGFFDPFMIGYVTNANGEKRTKLVSQGESNRITADDLF